MNKSGHYVVPEPVAFEEVLTVQELNEVDAFIYGDDMFEYADVHCQRGRANYFRTATGSMGPFLNTNLFSIPNKNGTVLRNLVKLQKENLAEMNSTDIINVHCKVRKHYNLPVARDKSIMFSESKFSTRTCCQLLFGRVEISATSFCPFTIVPWK